MSSDHPAILARLNERMEGLAGDAPEAMGAFMGLHEATTADGALAKSTKELIALAIGITVRCDGCIAFHVHDALAAGATHDEVVETIGVAVMMGGGPSVVYGAEAHEALREFEAVGT